MLKSKINGLLRIWFVFIHFNKTLLKYPRTLIKRVPEDRKEYKTNKTFRDHVDAMPNWIPLNIRILLRTIKDAWSIASLDFSDGLSGFYRYTLSRKVVNDVVVDMMEKGYITNTLIDKFIMHEESIKQGNIAGTGVVWDFYDVVTGKYEFNRPYITVLDSLLECKFISPVVYKTYKFELMRLDKILSDNDAFKYNGSLAGLLLKDYSDEYFNNKVYKMEVMTLTRLLKM